MTEKNEEKVLTDGSSCGNITLALNSTAPTESDARVVELVDSLASGASARKGVRVRLPPRAPSRKPLKTLRFQGFCCVYGQVFFPMFSPYRVFYAFFAA